MILGAPTESDVSQAVEAFNAIYGEMERALWCMAGAARDSLRRGQPSEACQALVWTIKSWWGIQGPKMSFKRIAADALASQDWPATLFDPPSVLDADAETVAVTRVSDLVAATVRGGSPRREFSLASKTLHWLVPWRVPVYDKFVREGVGVPETWYDADGYREIVRWHYRNARRLTGAGRAWMGGIEPVTPFRALDKYLWWLGGGDAGRAALVNDPWEPVRRLGIKPG